MKKATINQIKNFLDMNMQQFVSSSTFGSDSNIDKLLLSLQNKLVLKTYPYKIVCLDISHISWRNNSWWLSCMMWWFLTKSQYRQFKIPKEYAWDDYASIKYVINSYFSLSSKEQKNLDVNLFVIDGGKWQLNVITKLYEEFDSFKLIFDKIDFVSIWKWQARERKNKLKGAQEKILSLTDDFQIFEKEVDYQALEDKLLLKLRDEAHRFANRYRKIQWKTIRKTTKKLP